MHTNWCYACGLMLCRANNGIWGVLERLLGDMWVQVSKSMGSPWSKIRLWEMCSKACLTACAHNSMQKYSWWMVPNMCSTGLCQARQHMLFQQESSCCSKASVSHVQIAREQALAVYITCVCTLNSFLDGQLLCSACEVCIYKGSSRAKQTVWPP